MNDKVPHIDDNAIAKFLSGEANTTEINDLLDWMDLSDENRDRFIQFERVWSASKSNGQKPFNANRAWDNVSERLIQPKKRNMIPIYSGIAAALIGVIVLISQFVNTEKQSAPTLFAMSSSNEPKTVILPDSSTVILSANSRIEYQFDSIQNKRMAYLYGKAFFHVKHNEKQHFFVNTNRCGVEVLGTQFSVDVSKISETRVDVLSGKVRLFLPRASMDTLFLTITNNESAIISMQKQSITKQKQKASAFYFIDKTITFNNIDLPTIVSELKKCYSKEIEINPAVNRDIRFSSSFKDKSLDEILTVVTQTLNLDYKKEGNVYYITNKDYE